MTLYEFALGLKRYWCIFLGCILASTLVTVALFFFTQQDVKYEASIDVVVNSHFNSFIGVVQNQATAAASENPGTTIDAVPEVASKTLRISVTCTSPETAQRLATEVAASSVDLGRSFFEGVMDSEDDENAYIAFNAICGEPVVSEQAGMGVTKAVGAGLVCGVLFGLLVVAVFLLVRNPIIVPRDAGLDEVGRVVEASSIDGLKQSIVDIALLNFANGQRRLSLIPLSELSLSRDEMDQLLLGLESHGYIVVTEPDEPSARNHCSDAGNSPLVYICPPVSMGMDAIVAAKKSNMSILVMRRFRDRNECFESACNLFKMADIEKVFAVLFKG